MNTRRAAVAILILLLCGVGLEAAVAAHPGMAAAVVNVAHALHLTRYRATRFSATESVPYTVSERPDPTQPKGTQHVVHPGSNGTLFQTGIELVPPSGPPTRKIYESRLLASPTPAVIGTGTSSAYVHAGGQYYHYARMIRMTATAYNAGFASNGRWTGQPTALGVPLQYGVVAVDPRVIPLGTRLYVQGYGLAVAADTGSAIKGDRIDLFFWDSPADTAAFGIRQLSVYVLNDPKLPAVKRPSASG